MGVQVAPSTHSADGVPFGELIRGCRGVGWVGLGGWVGCEIFGVQAAPSMG